MNVSVNEKFPKELWNIILDYKKQFEKADKCFEYFMKNEEIRKYISEEELKKLISDTCLQCFYWYSD